MESYGMHPSKGIFGFSRYPRVIRVPQVVYRTIAKELLTKIREGVTSDEPLDLTTDIERDNGTYGWKYSIRCYVRHTTSCCPDGDDPVIEEVVPLWSEFKLWFSDEGDDLHNDFCAEKLRDHGIPYNKPFTTMGVRTGTQCVSRP